MRRHTQLVQGRCRYRRQHCTRRRPQYTLTMLGSNGGTDSQYSSHRKRISRLGCQTRVGRRSSRHKGRYTRNGLLYVVYFSDRHPRSLQLGICMSSLLLRLLSSTTECRISTTTFATTIHAGGSKTSIATQTTTQITYSMSTTVTIHAITGLILHHTMLLVVQVLQTNGIGVPLHIGGTTTSHRSATRGRVPFNVTLYIKCKVRRLLYPTCITRICNATCLNVHQIT